MMKTSHRKEFCLEILKKKTGFTLAEVLVTLGIIGVVAALTLPSLMANYQKRNAEAHLKHFYSLMRQGIEMTANDQGADCEIKQEYVHASNGFHTWWENCLGRELKTMDKKKFGSSIDEMVVLADGSAFTAYMPNTATVHFFYCTSPEKCAPERFDGRTSFLFTLIYTENNGMQFYTGSGDYGNSTRESLLANCRSGLAHEESDGGTISRRHTCAALIQRDGWKIAPDYPWQYSAREKK